MGSLNNNQQPPPLHTHTETLLDIFRRRYMTHHFANSTNDIILDGWRAGRILPGHRGFCLWHALLNSSNWKHSIRIQGFPAVTQTGYVIISVFQMRLRWILIPLKIWRHQSGSGIGWIAVSDVIDVTWCGQRVTSLKSAVKYWKWQKPIGEDVVQSSQVSYT